jgi:hypothetical protein
VWDDEDRNLSRSRFVPGRQVTKHHLQRRQRGGDLRGLGGERSVGAQAEGITQGAEALSSSGGVGPGAHLRELAGKGVETVVAERSDCCWHPDADCPIRKQKEPALFGLLAADTVAGLENGPGPPNVFGGAGGILSPKSSENFA